MVRVAQESRQGAEVELKGALSAPESSTRLKAVLAAGTNPNPGYVDLLIERCSVEPDFFVRDMLSWALIRHGATLIVDRLCQELSSDIPQARSQALHTLSKTGYARIWSLITPALLTDDDDEVARAAWRTAADAVPEGQESTLAEILTTQFGRGDRDVQLSLTRAFAILGPSVSPIVDRATIAADVRVRAHALVTERIMQHPDQGFDSALAKQDGRWRF